MRELRVPFEVLNRIFEYEPATGILQRRHSHRGRKVQSRDGKRRSTFVMVQGKKVQISHICWMLSYFHDALPNNAYMPTKIYFVDDNPLNTKLENLSYCRSYRPNGKKRKRTCRSRQHNMPLTVRNSRSGLRGEPN
jgi:hypothetical protein